MVPSVAKTGHSFKGAMAYYLHDKRPDGAAQAPQTADRVAWTEVRNLAIDDPQAAMRVMVATAQQADALKAAAGVKATGRKSNAHVYAYSLAWHPDEAGNLDRAEMIRAVDQSLKVLGAENHQAVIVCHTDQKHPHVHVIVNRVDPHTGKMLSTSNDRLKLSDWANKYERERGQIVTPKREEKRQLREQFSEAERREYAAQKKQEATDKPMSARSAGGILKEFQERQKADHKQQWADLSASNKSARASVYEAYDERIQEAIARHKAETKPIWASYFRQERTEARAFDKREQTVSGVISNALAATKYQRETGQLGERGNLSATFSNVLSSQARATAFAARQATSRNDMSRQLKAILDTEIRTLKEQRGLALTKQRQAFDEARASLIEKQDGERSKMREAWRQHYERQGQNGLRRDRRSTAQNLSAAAAIDKAAAAERRKVWQQARAQEKAQRAENHAQPGYRRDMNLPADQQEKGRARKARIEQHRTPPAPENPRMKGAFDKAREIEAGRIEQQRKLAAQKTLQKQQSLSVPSPAPHPAGVPSTATRTAQAVPRVDRAKEWAKTPEGRKAVPVQTPAARQFRNAATPAESVPAKATPAPRKDWDSVAKAKPVRRLPPRSNDRDRER